MSLTAWSIMFESCQSVKLLHCSIYLKTSAQKFDLKLAAVALMFKLFGLKVCLLFSSRHLLTIRRVTLTLLVEFFEFLMTLYLHCPNFPLHFALRITTRCNWPHMYLYFSMSSVPPCICTQFTDPQAAFLRSLTHYGSFKNVRSFFTTQ